MNRRSINLSSAVEAQRTLREHGIDIEERIDVFGLLQAEGLVTAFRPLPRLAGAYLPASEEGAGGVLINSNHPLSKQRYTAAHELGHHRLGHAESFDSETGFGTSSTSHPPDEIAAEAFAGHLLLPRRLLLASAEKLKVSLTDDLGCYRVALSAGASYSAVATQALVFNMITRSEYDCLIAATPASIKRRLVGSPGIAVGAGDVVLATVGCVTVVQPGDVVVVPAAPTGLAEFGPHLTAESPATILDEFCERVRVSEHATVNPDCPNVETHVVTVDGTRYDLVIERTRTGIGESQVRLG